MKTNDETSKLHDISMQFPFTFEVYKSSQSAPYSFEDFLKWLHKDNIRFKICHNIFRDEWYYDVWVWVAYNSPVRKTGMRLSSYDEAFKDGIVAICHVLEFNYKKQIKK
jgi:hypothetical protein